MKFLSKITVDSKLVRAKIHARKVWVDEKFDEPVEVVFLGERTLRNGRVEIDYLEGDSEFIPDEYINALLVIKDKRTNPFYVLESSINIEKTYFNSLNSK